MSGDLAWWRGSDGPREKVGDVEVRECEPGLKGWEDHLGAGMGSVEEWRCQMGHVTRGLAWKTILGR